MTNNKELYFGNDARTKIMAGIEKLTRAVTSTLGPKGRNVVIERENAVPISTKDGVSVAREINLSDKMENIGAQMIKEVATRTASTSGDGTTTATLLAASIFREGLKSVTVGSNPTEIRKGIDIAVSRIVKELEKITIQVSSKKELAQIGTLAANNDEEIGTLVANAMSAVGKDGIVTIEESRTKYTTMEIVEGLSIERGFLSPYFVSDQAKMQVEFEHALILLYDKKIETLASIIPILESVMAISKPLLLIADDFSQEVMAGLIVNKLKGILRVVAIKAPGFSTNRREMLTDISIITNGQVISEDIGMKLENVTIEQLGQCKRIVVDKNSTLIIDGAGETSKISARIKEIDVEIEKTTSDYDKEKLQERKSRLAGGISIIRVGAITETEMREKKDRVEDSLFAVRSATEEGILPGGGTVFIKIQHILNDIHGLSTDEQIGVDIIKKAIESPIRTICANANVEGSVVIEKIRNTKDINFGYNVRTNIYEDLVIAGVIDPTKVIRTALENAASIAGLLLTTEAIIINSSDEEKKDNQQMPDMNGMF